MTVSELLKSSLRLIGAVATGETPSADEMQDALSALNVMLDGWSTKRGAIFYTTLENFALVAGTGTYTIGTNGTFNTTRPTKVLSAFTRDSNGNDEEVEVYTDREKYNLITDKDASGRPEEILFVPTYALAYLYTYPVPDQAYTLYLETLKPLSQLSNLASDISLPEGYLRALKYNLAVEMAPEFGTAASIEVIKIAEESYADLLRQNTPLSEVQLDIPVSGGTMNIYTGR